MDIIIQSLGFKASDALQSFVKEKLSKVENDASKIARADVILHAGAKPNSGDNYCEIRLEIPGNDLIVKKSNEVFETAVADAVDTLLQMMRKEKDKRISRTRGDQLLDE